MIEAEVTTNPYISDGELIGNVSGKSVKDLKAKARELANKLGFSKGSVSIQDHENKKEWIIRVNL